MRGGRRRQRGGWLDLLCAFMRVDGTAALTGCLSDFSRVCEYVGTLEHTHFSDATSQAPVTISQPQKVSSSPGLLGDLECEGSPQEQSLEQGSSLSSAPVIQPLSIQELVREGSRGRASDFRGGSLMSGNSAAKVVLSLSTQADRCVAWPLTNHSQHHSRGNLMDYLSFKLF